MSVSRDDLLHVAALARLGVSESEADTLSRELSSILEHMAVLAKVNTDGVQEAIGVGARGLPTRGDHGPPLPLERAPESFAPRVRDGFFLVPRLASHESPTDE